MWKLKNLLIVLLCALGVSAVNSSAYGDSWSQSTFTDGTFSNTITTTGAADVVLVKGLLAPVIWSTMAAAPGAINAGGALAYPGSGDFIYGFKGGGYGAKTFYRYSISGNSWSTMAEAPIGIYDGGALAAGPGTGDFIYGLASGNYNGFYRYSISGNSWATMTLAPGSIYNGGALAYPGSGDFIYGFKAGNTTTFYRYSISGNSWATMTAAPGNIYTGGALASTGGDFIYGFAAYGTATFYRYSITGNSWATMTAAPGAISSGGALAYPGSGDFIYGFAGNNSTTFYRYSISGNSWTTSAAAPGAISSGGALASTGGDFIYGFAGNNSTTFYRCQVFGYPSPGTYTSTAITTTGVFAWGIITYTKTTPTNTILTVDVLSSSNNSLLLASVPSGTDLQLAYPATFANIIGIKLRGNLSTSDGANTPLLSDWYVQYNRPPVLVSPGNKNINENQLLTFTLSASDPDGDIIGYSMVGTPTGPAFQLVPAALNSSTGVFSWKPTYTQQGNYTVTFTATAKTLSNSKTITITVNDVPGYTDVTTTNWATIVKNGQRIAMGQENPYVSFKMNTVAGTAKWKRFRIDKNIAGSLTPIPDSKIIVSVWVETNNNGHFDRGDTRLAQGVFTNGTVLLDMNRCQVTTTQKTYYIVMKLADDTGGGQHAGATVLDSSYLEFENATCVGVPP